MLISDFQGLNDRMILCLESDDYEDITDHRLLPHKIQDGFKWKAAGMGSCCLNSIHKRSEYLGKEIMIILFKLKLISFINVAFDSFSGQGYI